MKKKLNANVIDSNVISDIINHMITNDIEIDENVSLRITKSEVREYNDSRNRKPSLKVTFSQKLSLKGARKVKCSVKLNFTGKGGINYMLRVSGSTSARCGKEKRQLLEAYTYAIIKAYLENDITLSGIYPEGLIYPDSERITGVNIKTNVKFESVKGGKGKTTKVEDDELIINVHKEEDPSPVYSEDDEEKYNQKIDEIRKKEKLSS